jgi:hypothetical protein
MALFYAESCYNVLVQFHYVVSTLITIQMRPAGILLHHVMN